MKALNPEILIEEVMVTPSNLGVSVYFQHYGGGSDEHFNNVLHDTEGKKCVREG